MTVTSAARSGASRAAGNPLFTSLTRAGFVGYGITHLLVAWLAVQIAMGHSAGAGDQGGALAVLADKPLGRFLVIAIMIGMIAMALWQLVAAVIGHTGDRGAERTAERIASAGRVAVYGYLAWTGWKVLSTATASSAAGQERTTAGLLAEPGGRWLVGLIGLALAGLGAGLIWYGLVRRFEKHLAMGEMTPGVRQWSRRLGTGGYVAKGIAYGIAGVLLVTAATGYDPAKARGLDGALRALVAQPAGNLLLVTIAAGIAAFAAFCFVQARYRQL